jgi:hypothetical protein
VRGFFLISDVKAAHWIQAHDRRIISIISHIALWAGCAKVVPIKRHPSVIVSEAGTKAAAKKGWRKKLMDGTGVSSIRLMASGPLVNIVSRVFSDPFP